MAYHLFPSDCGVVHYLSSSVCTSLQLRPLDRQYTPSVLSTKYFDF